MWERLARTLAQRLPLPILLHPFDIFLGGLCVLSGVPLLLAYTPQPDSLEALLPTWLVFTWGAELVIGGAALVAGVVWEWRTLQRFGLVLLGPAAIVYAIAIMLTAGRSGLVAAAIVLAFGLACLIKLITLSVVRAAILERASL
jgi:hypothetical protein